MKLVVVENPRPLTVEHYNDVANAPLSASLNSGYALAVSRRAGWDAAHLDFTTSTMSPGEMSAAILAENPDMILFHWVYAWGNEVAVAAVLDLLKKEGGPPAGAFGLFPTLARSELHEFAPGLDFIIAGEFEQTLEELLPEFQRSRSVASLPGISLPGLPFAVRPVVTDPSILPVPDDVGAFSSRDVMNIAASRGCFGNCGFCFIASYYGCDGRRVRSIPSFAHELEVRLKRRPVDHLYFVDPTFIGYGAAERERVAGVSRVAKSVGIPFGFETRVDTVDEKLMAELAGNGASSVFLGIESGCDAALGRMNKRVTTKDITRAVRCIQEHGLRLNVGFIMFEADSTLEELRENFAFLEGLGLLSDHDLTINMLYHSQIVLRGSRGWKRFHGEGRLLLDEKLPFEANYTFLHANVARVCLAMKRIATEYFLRMDMLRASGQGVRPAAGKDAGLNNLLKEAFLAFVSGADAPVSRLTALEERFMADVHAWFGGTEIPVP